MQVSTQVHQSHEAKDHTCKWTQIMNQHIEAYLHLNIREIVERAMPQSLAKYQGSSKRCRVKYGQPALEGEHLFQ